MSIFKWKGWKTLGGVLGTAVPAIGAGLNLIGSLKQNKAQGEQAQKQMDFQERMSSTAYQRATKDMEAAGINPMLAYAQGGADTPGGAQASMENVLSPAVSSAMQLKELKSRLLTAGAERDESVSRRALNDAHNALAGSQMTQNEILGREAMARTDESRARAAFTALQGASTAAALVSERQRAKIEGSSAGLALSWIQKIRESLMGSSPFMFGPRFGLPVRLPADEPRKEIGGFR